MSDIQDRYSFIDLANFEHRQVRGIVRAIEQALRIQPAKSPAKAGQADRVAKLLGELADEIRRHFVKEREGGVLEEAACRVPALATRVGPVMEAWPAMVARIESLRELVSERTGQGRIPAAMSALIHRALHDVSALEATEDEILSSAFGVNLDGSDSAKDR